MSSPRMGEDPLFSKDFFRQFLANFCVNVLIGAITPVWAIVSNNVRFISLPYEMPGIIITALESVAAGILVFTLFFCLNRRRKKPLRPALLVLLTLTLTLPVAFYLGYKLNTSFQTPSRLFDTDITPETLRETPEFVIRRPYTELALEISGEFSPQMFLLKLEADDKASWIALEIIGYEKAGEITSGDYYRIKPGPVTVSGPFMPGDTLRLYFLNGTAFEGRLNLSLQGVRKGAK